MDIDNLKAAAAQVKTQELFMPSVAPGSLVSRRNEHYGTEEAYLGALADAMKIEYKAIVDAGFILSLDDPGIAVFYDRGDTLMSPEQYRKQIMPRIEALNHALQGIPEHHVRYHVCWGGWHGPHSTDFPLKELMPVILKARVGGYLIEAGEARIADRRRTTCDPAALEPLTGPDGHIPEERPKTLRDGNRRGTVQIDP